MSLMGLKKSPSMAYRSGPHVSLQVNYTFLLTVTFHIKYNPTWVGEIYGILVGNIH